MPNRVFARQVRERWYKIEEYRDGGGRRRQKTLGAIDEDEVFRFNALGSAQEAPEGRGAHADGEAEVLIEAEHYPVIPDRLETIQRIQTFFDSPCFRSFVMTRHHPDDADSPNFIRVNFVVDISWWIR